MYSILAFPAPREVYRSVKNFRLHADDATATRLSFSQSLLQPCSTLSSNRCFAGCGFCKRFKPVFAEVATEKKGAVVSPCSACCV